MISKVNPPTSPWLMIAGAGAALALLIAFTAIVDDAVKAGQQRVLSADAGARAPALRTPPAAMAPLRDRRAP